MSTISHFFRHPIAAIIAAIIVVAALLSSASCALVSGIADYEMLPDPAVGTIDGGDGADGGELVPSTIQATPASIDFGNVRCGTASTMTKEIVIENRGDIETPWTATLPSSSSFELVGAGADNRLTGTLGPHATKTIVVKAKPVVPGPQRIELAIETAAGTAITKVTITALAQGVSIDANPSIVDFGDVRFQNGGGPIPIAFTNKGTDPVTLNLSSDGVDFDVTPAMLNLPPGASGAANATLKSGVAADTVLVRPLLLIVSDETVLCGNLPSVELRGRRIVTDVTTSPGTLDFGNVGCGPTPPSKEITITNYAMNGAVNITTAWSANARFTVTGAPQTIPAAPSVSSPSIGKLIVKPTSPLMAPVGNANASLQVTLAGPPITNGSEQRTIPALMFVMGPIITFTQGDTLDFGRVSKGNGRNKELYLQNTGNVAVQLNYSVQSNPPAQNNTFMLTGPDQDGVDTLTVGSGPEEIALRFEPKNNGTFTGSVTITPSVPACSAPITGILKGTTEAGGFGNGN